MDSFTDLKAWQVGMQLMTEVHELTETFPRNEKRALTKQLRSCTRSVVANTAEGFGRFTFPDKANKYTIARGECNEATAHLYVAVALQFVTQERAQRAIQLSHEVARILSGLIRACRARS